MKRGLLQLLLPGLLALQGPIRGHDLSAPGNAPSQEAFGSAEPVPHQLGSPVARFKLISHVGSAKAPSGMNSFSLPDMPVAITVSASDSTDGLSASGADNWWFAWDWGDGGRNLVWRCPINSHIYTATGTFAVVLTVTNTAGNWSRATNWFQIIGKSPSFTNHLWLVATNGDDHHDGTNAALATINEAARLAQPGDIVSVGPGNYPEIAHFARPDGDRPVFFLGHSSSNDGWNIRTSDCVVDGFCLTGGRKSSAYVVQVAPTAQRVQLRNLEFGHVTNLNAILFDRGRGADPALSAGYGSVSNCFMHDCWAGTNHNTPIFVVSFGYSNSFCGNICISNQGEADVFRLWGQGHVAARNYVRDHSSLLEYHTDFYQIYGPRRSTNYDYAKDILLEANWVQGGRISTCEIQSYAQTNAPGMYTNIVFRNNVFIGMVYGAAASCDGVKFINNLWYDCQLANSGIIVGGGSSGTCYDTLIRNNIFALNCLRAGISGGWYDARMGPGVPGSHGNGSLDGDYDFVCRAGFGRARAVPPSDFQRWAANGYEKHGINGGDPKFVSATDYHLRPKSPLASAGALIPGLTATVDFDGKPWPNGIPSIGPFGPAGER